jgi:VWFA-related protein
MVRRLATLALLLTLCSGAGPSAALAQEAEKHVYVTVLGGDGAPIIDLTAQHFAVRESGKDRVVVRVEPLRVPMHAVVMLDLGAIAQATHQTFRSDVAEFVVRLAAFNKVALYTFGENTLPLVPFTQDAAQLRNAVTTIVALPGRSNLLDAVTRAVQDLEPIETARPAIIVIGTQSPEASRASAGSVIKKLIAASTAFHVITLASTGVGGATTVPAAAAGDRVPTASQRMQGMTSFGEGERERERLLKEGTTTTGGSLQRLTSTLAVSDALNRLAREMSNGYRVTFSRSGNDKIKDLQVGVMLEGVTLRATAAPFGTR